MYQHLSMAYDHPLNSPRVLTFVGAGSPSGGRAVAPGGAAGAAVTLVLRAEQGPLAGRQVPVVGSPFTLGRNPDNSLVLPEAQVSRHHARLDWREGRWFLQDLHSANGTFVNRQRLSPEQGVPLSSGDLIGVGESVFTALLQAPPRHAAASPAGARPAPRPQRTAPWAALIVGLVLLAVVVAVAWVLINQLGQEEEVAPAPSLPTIQLPEVEIPTVQIPTINLPTLEIPTNLPVPTVASDLLKPVQTVLPELKLPFKTPEP